MSEDSIPIKIPAAVSPRAHAWALSIMQLDPQPRTPEELAVLLQAVMDDERQQALRIVERALVATF